jgi:hypothetical protein
MMTILTKFNVLSNPKKFNLGIFSIAFLFSVMITSLIFLELKSQKQMA